MHSKDVLLQALKDFDGTVIFVSHDRGFIEDLSTKVLELHPGVFREFSGDYKYYIQRLEAEENGLEKSPLSSTANSQAAAKEEVKATETKLNWEEQKKQQAERRKLEKEVERLESEIQEKENEKEALINQLSLPENYSDGEKSKNIKNKIDEIEAKLEELNSLWEEKATLL